MSPIRVDFYLLESIQADAKWLIACRLLEKAYLKGHKVYVHCNKKEEAEYLDELLWTFKNDSFIPHNLQGEGPAFPPPIQLGFAHQPKGFNDILMNLSQELPPFFSRFKRVIEIVSNVETEKQNSRTLYKLYRSRGCDLHTHAISLS